MGLQAGGLLTGILRYEMDPGIWTKSKRAPRVTVYKKAISSIPVESSREIDGEKKDASIFSQTVNVPVGKFS